MQKPPPQIVTLIRIFLGEAVFLLKSTFFRIFWFFSFSNVNNLSNQKSCKGNYILFLMANQGKKFFWKNLASTESYSSFLSNFRRWRPFSFWNAHFTEFWEFFRFRARINRTTTKSMKEIPSYLCRRIQEKSFWKISSLHRVTEHLSNFIENFSHNEDWKKGPLNGKLQNFDKNLL